MSEKKITLRELVENIDFKLTHLEDIEADNRELIIKLIKQGNTIVEFLKQFDIEDDVDSFEMGLPELPDISEKTSTTKVISLKDLLDEYMEKHKDLKEFEEELKKHKDDITPGQVGES